MNKAELVTQVAEQCDMSKAAAQKAVEATFECITMCMQKGDECSIPRFGKFYSTQRAASEGRNPRTGEPLKIPASNVAKFKAGKELKEAVNKKKGKR